MRYRDEFRSGHRTSVVVEQSTTRDPGKGAILNNFKKNFGVALVNGDINDHNNLVKELKKTDVVISTIVCLRVAEQTKIIAAIKQAGNVKRFVPSEFGLDTAHAKVVEPARSAILAKQVQIRRVIEAERIPFTYVLSSDLAEQYVFTLGQLGLTSPPSDNRINIFGDGNVKAVFSTKEDIGTYTIKAVDDPRTLNKSVFIKPPKNVHSMNELVALWEKKTGKTLKKFYDTGEILLKEITESLIKSPFTLAINHSVFINGDLTNFEIDPSWGFEASELYSDVKYTTAEEYLDQFLRHYS